MAVSVVMPALEIAQETGKLVSWKKNEGEKVAKGDMLLEVETDKAFVEVEAQADGILGGVTARVGDVVPVGQTIAWLLAAGEKAPVASTPAKTGPLLVSPKARRLAKELGVDVSALRGSGPDGEIIAADVQEAAKSAP